MEDENRSSKKRAAGRQLSRDNPGLDEEDVPEPELGSFKRASDDVLAGRNFFKVRRQQKYSAAPSAPSSNPFAGIRLVPPPTIPATSLTNASDVPCKNDETDEEGEVTSKELEEKRAEVAAESGEKKDAPMKQTVEANQNHTEPELTDLDKGEAMENTGESSPTDEKEVAGNAEETAEAELADEEQADSENIVKKDPEHSQANGGGYASFSSFHQLSNNQNAFSGLASSGFSSSTFSFGSIQNDESGSQSTLPSIGFGTSNNDSTSVFGTIGASSLGSKSKGPAFPTMPEVPKETGEENEETVFSADSALFEFVDGGWKERGKGEMKVNVLKDEERKARFVMRTKGNLRLILNASLYPDMKLAEMDKKGITFPCVNTATEGKDGLSTFALKFKDISVLEEFCSTVSAHSGETATVLKTPENSPKRSEN